MAKNQRATSSNGSKKFTATLPYLRPMNDEEIDRLEIEASLCGFLQKETHEETFFEWMMEIDFAKIDFEMDDEICRQMELSRVRRVNPPNIRHPFFFDDSDCWDMHSEDLDWDPRDESISEDHMYLDDDLDFYTWEDHQMLLSVGVRELSHCPEQELIRQIPLRGLPQQARRELIREYCVI